MMLPLVLSGCHAMIGLGMQGRDSGFDLLDEGESVPRVYTGTILWFRTALAFPPNDEPSDWIIFPYLVAFELPLSFAVDTLPQDRCCMCAP